MGAVYANNRAIIHKGDGSKFIAAAPDVCKTPSPGGPIPVPYPNIAKSSDLAKGTKKVKIKGNSVAIKGANLNTSTGDEAGTAGGGIISSKTKGKLTWGASSIDVKFEGKAVIRFLDPTLHNGNGSNSGGLSPGDNYMMPTPEFCLNCGKSFEYHIENDFFKPKEIIADPDLRKEAQTDKNIRKDRRAHIVGGLKADCKPDYLPKPILTRAGKILKGWLSPDDPIINFDSGKPIALDQKKRDKIGRGKNRNPVGNCVEQKTLDKAYKDAKRLNKPFPGNCKLSMGVGNKKDKYGDDMAEPCETCKEIIMAMLCTNNDKKRTKGKKPEGSK